MKTITFLTLAAIATASAANASVARLDKNGDNVISASEFLNVYGPDRGIEQFNHADTNNDRVIDAGEFAAESGSHGIFEGNI